MSPNKSSTSIGSTHTTPEENTDDGGPPKKRGRPKFVLAMCPISILSDYSRRSNGERKSYEHQLAVNEDDDSETSPAPVDEVRWRVHVREGVLYSV